MTRDRTGSTPGPSWVAELFAADGWVRFLAALASRLYLGVMLCLALFAVLPILFGWHGTVVQSGSMEPHISRGDVVPPHWVLTVLFQWAEWWNTAALRRPNQAG